MDFILGTCKVTLFNLVNYIVTDTAPFIKCFNILVIQIIIYYIGILYNIKLCLGVCKNCLNIILIILIS